MRWLPGHRFCTDVLHGGCGFNVFGCFHLHLTIALSPVQAPARRLPLDIMRQTQRAQTVPCDDSGLLWSSGQREADKKVLGRCFCGAGLTPCARRGCFLLICHNLGKTLALQNPFACFHARREGLPSRLFVGRVRFFSPDGQGFEKHTHQIIDPEEPSCVLGQVSRLLAS